MRTIAIAIVIRVLDTVKCKSLLIGKRPRIEIGAEICILDLIPGLWCQGPNPKGGGLVKLKALLDWKGGGYERQMHFALRFTFRGMHFWK